ncbi:MAG: DUF4416 family protein [Candidatus Omnitrophica bacterium]|nr:DUF4416 family protein [Candidatus Omnitrophota bacterium]MBU2044482.1 DUF4416 family protein [Candidatus Omnitrophota bacterium]MBU2266056.1 DUF4416 family protein [Candidatus Omnitrophota bacterium]MBU2474112.1 DUF4416 family protein [Candidatus Omnitrophota bacterium]
MLELQFPKPVKFICGFIYSDQMSYQQVKKTLERKFAKVDSESQEIPFNYTDYYQKEMGSGLIRRFISFSRLRQSQDLVKFKLLCLKLERRFAPDRKRIVNIDPGYLNEAKLVLATTKDFSHRLYLDKGVYAEVTLQFKAGAYSDLATTFPDYRTKEYKNIFMSIRSIYRQDLKKNRGK